MIDQPTPETDAYCKAHNVVTGRPGCVESDLADFARTLERQRDAARAELERMKASLSKDGEIIAEWFAFHEKKSAQLRADLTAAREEITSLKYTINP